MIEPRAGPGRSIYDASARPLCKTLDPLYARDLPPPAHEPLRARPSTHAGSPRKRMHPVNPALAPTHRPDRMHTPVIPNNRLAGLLVGVTAGVLALGACVCSSPPNQPELLQPDAGDASLKDVGQEHPVAGDAAWEESSVPKDAAPEAWDADAGELPAELGWLVDPALWVELAAVTFVPPEDGRIYEALHKKLPPLALQWNPCGSGCRWADTIQGIGTYSARALLQTDQQGTLARSYMSVNQSIALGDKFVAVRRIIRLDDGITIGALRKDVKKIVQYSPAEFVSTSVLTPGILGGPSTSPDETWQLHGRASTDGSAWTWAIPASPSYKGTVNPFDISYGGGQIFRVGLGSVIALQDMHVNQWTTLEEPSSAKDAAAGQGDLALWTDFGGIQHLRLRGWAPDGKAVRTILDPIPDKTMVVAVSPTRIVGLTAASSSGSTLWGARAWVSPRAYSTAESSIQLGPELAESPVVLGQSLRTWGDWAVGWAADVAIDDAGSKSYGAYHFVIIHLPTWKSWRLDSAPGRVFRDSYAVDGTYLHAIDSEASALSTHISRVYRYELGTIEQWAKAL